jgi:hypothetical protein
MQLREEAEAAQVQRAFVREDIERLGFYINDPETNFR